jgi:hypothetical protein
MATRDEVHRLIDAVPEEQVTVIGEVLRAAVETGMAGEQARRLAEQMQAPIRLPSEPIRTFASMGTLSAESDLAERAEQILAPRTAPPHDPGRHRADRSRDQ